MKPMTKKKILELCLSQVTQEEWKNIPPLKQLGLNETYSKYDYYSKNITVFGEAFTIRIYARRIGFYPINITSKRKSLFINFYN